MAETLEQIKEELGKANRGLLDAKEQLNAAKSELEKRSANQGVLEEKITKLEADRDRISKEHDEITKRLQDPTRNLLPGTDAADKAGQEVAKRAWGKYLRAKDDNQLATLLTKEEQEFCMSVPAAKEKRSIYVSADEMGGFLVNPVVSNRIVEKVVQVSPVRALATVMGISLGQEISFPREKDTLTARWTQERGTRQDGTPSGGAFEKRNIQTHEQSVIVPITYQMIEDSAFNIEGWAESRAARQFARGEGIAFLTGDGNGRPRGLLTSGNGIATQAATTGGGVGTFGPDDVIDLAANVISEYAANGSYLLSRITMANVRKFKDNQNRYLQLVQPDILAAMSGKRQMLIDGYPAVEMPNMSNWGTATANVMVFGDIREAYTVVDRSVMTVIRDIYTQKANGMVELLFMRRVGGDVVQPDAARILVSSAS